MGGADLFVNGRVFTGTGFAEALLVVEGRVEEVGTDRAVRRRAPTGTATHDLEGHLLLPGLIDAHLHLGEIARGRESLSLRGVGSLDALVDAVRAWADAHPGRPVLGTGWEREQFRERRDPDRRLLDRAVDDRPVLLYHTSGHAAAANGAMLAAAGFDRPEPDPPRGRVGRTSDGSADGLLYEDAVRAATAAVAAGTAPSDAGLEGAAREAAALGLTTVATMHASRAEVDALTGLAAADRLPVRVRAYLRLAEASSRRGPWAPGGAPDGRVRVRGVKAFTDGAFGPRTAWLSEPYADSPEETGFAVGTEEELGKALAEAAAQGFAPAVHAIGDRAVARALRLLAPLGTVGGPPARIEHAALTPPELLPALDRVRPALVVQPGFLWSDAWLAERLGRERARWAYAFRTLLDRGHLLAGSSDAPFDPLDPWRGLRAAGERRSPTGESANPDPSEALPAEEAVLLYTRNGGRALGEPALGVLAPGGPADLVRLRTGDLGRALREGAASVAETWVDGVRVAGRADGRDP